MKKFSNILFYTAQTVVGIALAIIFLTSFSNLKNIHDSFSNTIFAIIAFSAISGIFLIHNKKINTKLKLVLLIIIAAIPRIWWLFTVNSIPVSDFETMYLSAREILDGNFSSMRGFAYLSRFPHLITTTLYMAGMIKLFSPHQIIALKFVNLILSLATVYLMYVLAKYFFASEKSKLYTMLISSVFPPFISFVSVFCTENIAIPFYLLSLIILFKAEKTKRLSLMFLSGIVFAVANLFRALGVAFIIAVIIYFLLFSEKKFKKIISLTAGFLSLTVIVSALLLSFKVIERPLWKGTEPSYAALFLKGSNVEHKGMWNEQDAVYITENLGDEKLAEICFKKGFERIFSLSTKEFYNFYSDKFSIQWTVGDCSGTSWSFIGLDEKPKNLLPFPFQLTYIIIIFLSLISCLKKRKCNSIFLLYTLLSGLGLLFLIIETQSRYAYIISWVFIIFAVSGIEVLKDRYCLLKNKLKRRL